MENIVVPTRRDLYSRVSLITIALGALTFFIIVSFFLTANFGIVYSKKTTSERLTVSNELVLPLDEGNSGTVGSIRYNVTESEIQVYDGQEWTGISSDSDIVESPDSSTDVGLIGGLNDPIPNFTSFQTSFNGGLTLVSTESLLNSALTAANENGIIRLTANISCLSTLTIPNKSLWIDLNSFTLSVPVQTTFSINCQQVNKTIYFSNGTIQYNPDGITGPSSNIIRVLNCTLVVRNVSIIHGEYAISYGGTSGNDMKFYTSDSIYRLTKARSSNNNTYGAFLLGGSVTADSYTYLKSCIFDTVSTDTFLNMATDNYNMRGVVRVNGSIPEGVFAMTGCTINPAHRMQAVFYSDVISLSPSARGNFKILMDSNTIGDAGEREQLILLIGNNTLNGFSSIWAVENKFERMDSNKGIIYVDADAGGSTDVKWYDNDIPVMKNVQPVIFADAVFERDDDNVIITTPSPHLFRVGYAITLTSSSVGVSDGSYKIQEIISPTSFRIIDPIGPLGKEVTITSPKEHNLEAGKLINLNLSDVGLASGVYKVHSVVNPTQFTVLENVSTHSNGTTTVLDPLASSLRKNVSKDGFVRGRSSISRTYLQTYSF